MTHPMGLRGRQEEMEETIHSISIDVNTQDAAIAVAPGKSPGVKGRTRSASPESSASTVSEIKLERGNATNVATMTDTRGKKTTVMVRSNARTRARKTVNPQAAETRGMSNDEDFAEMKTKHPTESPLDLERDTVEPRIEQLRSLYSNIGVQMDSDCMSLVPQRGHIEPAEDSGSSETRNLDYERSHVPDDRDGLLRELRERQVELEKCAEFNRTLVGILERERMRTEDLERQLALRQDQVRQYRYGSQYAEQLSRAQRHVERLTRRRDDLEEDNRLEKERRFELEKDLAKIQDAVLSSVDQFQATQDSDLKNGFEKLRGNIMSVSRTLVRQLKDVDSQALDAKFARRCVSETVGPGHWARGPLRKFLFESVIWKTLAQYLFYSPYQVYGGDWAVLQKVWEEMFVRDLRGPLNPLR